MSALVSVHAEECLPTPPYDEMDADGLQFLGGILDTTFTTKKCVENITVDEAVKFVCKKR